ncbi:basic proline-rich protein-like [Colius striatus]|uniref:basic proline-rich protein-like n=1 Tax=Colius striatus TaxID=57412 RepID=UPI002B1E085D|nr:basic proline-rich protein-like [Colius striatus]
MFQHSTRPPSFLPPPPAFWPSHTRPILSELPRSSCTGTKPQPPGSRSQRRPQACSGRGLEDNRPGLEDNEPGPEHNELWDAPQGPRSGQAARPAPLTPPSRPTATRPHAPRPRPVPGALRASPEPRLAPRGPAPRSLPPARRRDSLSGPPLSNPAASGTRRRM